ncbi:MAG: hypothetical protein J0L94_01110 [Rhodothermia bacterium]|nr:hypothetical protein [Rhodothermia bacterium]
MIQIIGLMVGVYVFVRFVDLYTRVMMDGKTYVHSDRARKAALLGAIAVGFLMILLVMQK